MEIFAPPGMEELTQQIQGMFQNLGGARKRLRKMKVRDAMKMITDEEAARLVNDEDLRAKALANVEQNGIVFLDEIDKIASRGEIAWSVNEKTENIGARRLHTVMEKLLEEISFEAGKRGRESVRIDAVFVDAKLKELAQSEDLARFVL